MKLKACPELVVLKDYVANLTGQANLPPSYEIVRDLADLIAKCPPNCICFRVVEKIGDPTWLEVDEAMPYLFDKVVLANWGISSIYYTGMCMPHNGFYDVVCLRLNPRN